MAGLVLDCSVTASWVLPDEASSKSRLILALVTVSGAVVPSNWPLETAQSLLSAERRGRIVEDDRERALAILARLPISVDTETPRLAWRDIVAVAKTHGLTLNDAAYLELALRRNLPLATFDRFLEAAARSAGLPPLPSA